MKLRVCCLLAAIMLLCSACGNQSAPSTGAPSGGAELESAAFSSGDLYLTIDGARYVCDVSIDTITAALGDGYTYNEAMSCAYDGMDKIFSYGDVDFSTVPKSEGDMVSEIYVSGGEVKTSKGIALGATLADIEAAYGTDYEAAGIIITYEIPPANAESEGASLYFTMAGDTVSAIAITAEQLIGE